MEKIDVIICACTILCTKISQTYFDENVVCNKVEFFENLIAKHAPKAIIFLLEIMSWNLKKNQEGCKIGIKTEHDPIWEFPFFLSHMMHFT